MSKIIVTGGKGQLGQTLRREMSEAGIMDVDFIDFEELDITDEDAVRLYFHNHPCDILINCAAYTAVDKAETEYEKAFRINGIGPLNLALSAKETGFKIIHISTDYVFSGEGSAPYKEDDVMSEEEVDGPHTVYGRSKLMGETALRMIVPERQVTIRTSWLYSEYGHNFFKTMFERAMKDQNVKVVMDQFGSPTYAGDLAKAIIAIIKNENWYPGIYHYCNDGIITWYDFASAIYEEAAKGKNRVTPISSESYPTDARRPKYSALETTKIKEIYGIDCPDWRSSLHKMIKEYI